MERKNLQKKNKILKTNSAKSSKVAKPEVKILRKPFKFESKKNLISNLTSKVENVIEKAKDTKLVPIDKILLFSFVLLIIFGTLFIFDASAVVASNPPYNNQFAILFKHLIFLGIGSISAFIISKFKLEILGKFSLIGLIICIIGLFVTLLPGVGVTGNGATRWIQVGNFTTIQFSELIKPILFLYLAFWLSRLENYLSSISSELNFISQYLKKKLIPFLIICGLVIFPIILQKDLGSVIVIGITSLIIYLFSSRSKLNLIFSILILLVGTISVIGLIYAESYRVGRFEVYSQILKTGRLSPEIAQADGYQIQQVLIAIGTGGVGGIGLGESKQKYFYLVDQTSYTDTIFAVISEELGLVGSSSLVLGILFIIFRGLSFANKHKFLPNQLSIIGIICWIGIQSFINIAANVSLIPFKGLTLPFISYGGSSLLGLMIGLGIIFSKKYE